MKTVCLLLEALLALMLFLPAAPEHVNCIRNVVMSGQQSYTEKEITSQYVYYTQCGWKKCSRLCSGLRYVQSHITFYYVGYQCCVGYRNIGTDGKLLCEPYPEIFFQLLFTSQSHSCELWKGFKREIAFAQELSAQLSSICACHIYQSNITDVQVVCNDKIPGVVVFQGRIISTDERNASQLIDDLESIVSNRENFTVSGEMLTLLDNCTCCNIITEFELGIEPAADNCVGRVTDQATETDSTAAIVGGSIGALLAVLLAVAGLLFAICRCFLRRNGRQRGGDEQQGEGDRLVVAGDGGPG